MKHAKRILAIMMTVFMLAGMLPAALADSADCGHENTDVRYPNGTPTDCQDARLSEYYCQDCGTVFESDMVTGRCADGEWRWEGAAPASCLDWGMYVKFCYKCGNGMEEMEMQGPHNWVTNTISEPTCTEQGYCEIVCTYCGAGSGSFESIRELGHNYGDWQLYAEGNCIAPAEEYRECSRCGDRQWRNGDYGDHKWGEWERVKEPTYTEEGIEERVCSVCAKVEQRAIPKLVEPTVKPTEKPTAKPTEKPTAKPTQKPTEKPVATPEATDDGGIILTKAINDTPENGMWYCEGEAITFAVTIENTSDKEYYDVIVYDPILEYAELKPYDIVEPGFSETIEFDYVVTSEDALAYIVENVAFLIHFDGESFSDRIYSNPVVAPCGPADQNNDDAVLLGGVELTKSCVSAPANGEYYQPGESVTYLLAVKNAGDTVLHDVTVRDNLYSVSEPVAIFESMEPGDAFEAYFDYIVTEIDAVNGKVRNIAQVVSYDPDGKALISISNEVEVLAGMEGDLPFGVITEMTIIKAETSTPANGSYYVEGETINYNITYVNSGETKFGETIIYDTLAAGDGEIATAEMLDAGESRTCTFSYVVTADDVAKGYVVNSAIAKFDIGNGFINIATSEPVVSDTDGDASTTYVPGTGTIDWELIGKPGAEETVIDEKCHVVPSADTCYVKAVSRDGDSIEYEVHFCSEHAQIQKSILTMANAADDEYKLQKVWDYAIAMWQNAIDVQYEELVSACDDAAKIIVLNERAAYMAMIENARLALEIAQPDKPAENAYVIAQLLQDKCIDLCYIMNTAPSDRVDSIFNVERIQNEVEIYVSCASVIIEEIDGKLSYTDQYCMTHGFTYEMMELLLENDNSLDAWVIVRSLWEIELSNAYNALCENVSETVGNAYLSEYMGYLKWINAYEQFMTIVYPDKPELVAEVMVNVIMDRTMDICEIIE